LDTQKYLRTADDVIDLIFKELQKNLPLIKDPQGTNTDLLKSIKSEKEFSFDPKAQVQFMDEQLNIIIMAEYSCVICSKSISEIERHNYLKIPTPSNEKSLQLEKCISSFLGEQIQVRDEVCSNCKNSNRLFKRSLRILKPSKILCLSLVRFPSIEDPKKIETSINFPLENLQVDR
jgi:ubiquitin C-terminal hydrolase